MSGRYGVVSLLAALALAACRVGPPGPDPVPARPAPVGTTPFADPQGTGYDDTAAPYDDTAAPYDDTAAPYDDTAAAEASPSAMAVATQVPADSSTFEVEWRDEVTRVDAAQAALLLASDLAAGVFELDAAGVRAAGLDLGAGRVLVLDGLAVARITGVEPRGDRLIVQTEDATLVDAIERGTIAWEHDIRFAAERIAPPVVGGKTVEPQGDTLSFRIDLESYAVAVEVKLLGERCEFKLELEKDLPGEAGAKFAIEGFLETFTSRDRIDIEGGAVKAFEHGLDGLRGEATLSATVAASGRDMFNSSLPIPLLEIPFTVGPIPVSLKLTAQLLVNALIPLEGSARAEVKFAYDSALGFSYRGGRIRAGGRLGDHEIGEQAEPHVGAAGAAAVNFGVGFPRVELSILRKSVVPWAQLAYLVGGSFTFRPACQLMQALILGAAGYKLSVLGILDLAEDSIEFFREERTLLRAGECP
ncbi:MAG: hypothetical protein JXB32_25615 [Deltaproteobacteria bacterium]|nr:hypothetical protein [Deltaproteobacteria bacterium]